MHSTLAHLLRRYCEIFARRPDVLVVDYDLLPPLSAAERLARVKDLPGELIAISSELGGLELTWVFESDKEDHAAHPKGFRGGHLRIPSFRTLLWRPAPEWFRASATHYAIVDELDDHRMGCYVRREGDTMRWTGFADSNGRTFQSQGSLSEYLEDGAKHGFVWDWQTDTCELESLYGNPVVHVGHRGHDLRERLRAASLPKDTKAAEIDRRLIEAGATAQEASDLRAWLGEEARVLLHRDGLQAPAEKHAPG